MEQNKSNTIEYAVKVVIKEMGIKTLDKFNTSNNYRQKLAETINKTAEKYQLQPKTLNRLFQ
jgi:hypothetical protein